MDITTLIGTGSNVIGSACIKYYVKRVNALIYKYKNAEVISIWIDKAGGGDRIYKTTGVSLYKEFYRLYL